MLHARTNDPETSKETAMKATANLPDSKAATLVYEAMTAKDTPMIDEEIAEEVYKQNPMFAPSPDRLRHGRKELEKTGTIERCGKKKTTRGCNSILWKLKEDKPCVTSR